MISVFGDLSLNTITDPLGSNQGSGAFYFQKGTVDSYHYKNLSGGEKAAFDLILDLHLKRRFSRTQSTVSMRLNHIYIPKSKEQC